MRHAKIERARKLDAITCSFETSVVRLTQALAAEMEATARSLAQTADETNRQAVDVAASAEQTSGNVQTVAGATDELAASIREITRQITASSHTASRAVENVKHTDQTIQSLAEATQKIGSVVALISGVASQTNLLALNATIEAARAGDSGPARERADSAEGPSGREGARPPCASPAAARGSRAPPLSARR